MSRNLLRSLRHLPLYSVLSGIALMLAVLVFLTLQMFPDDDGGKQQNLLAAIPYVIATLGVVPILAAVFDLLRIQRLRNLGRSAIAPEGSDAVQDAELQIDDETRLWVREQTEQLNERDAAINERALALQQWLQFPTTENVIANQDDGSPAINSLQSQVTAVTQSASDESQQEKTDQQLMHLIEQCSQQLFDHIRQDRYAGDSESGGLNTQLIREDFVELMTDVAKIYQPDDPNPLLNTNVESITRSVARVGLRFLVAVESLPGGLHTQDLTRLYAVMRTATRTYSAYKASRPYWEVASGALFAGRVVMGANPLTLAAWWAVSRAATYGVSQLGQQLMDQQVLGLIRRLIELVAIETASLYSPTLRFRDPNWIYAVELVELLSIVPANDAARMAAIQEIASIDLNDEYGRVLLLRQLAAGISSHPDRYQPGSVLPPQHRRAVAQRLEQFLIKHFLHDQSKPNPRLNRRIESWQDAAAQRLEIQFHGDGSADPSTWSDEQHTRYKHLAIRSLASLLIHHRQLEPRPAMEWLRESSRIAAQLDAESWKSILADVCDQPPFYFESPQIPAGSPLSEQFLDDCLELLQRVPWSLSAGETEVSQAAKPLAVGAGRELPLLEDPADAALNTCVYFLGGDAGKYLQRRQKQRLQRLNEKSSVTITESDADEKDASIDPPAIDLDEQRAIALESLLLIHGEPPLGYVYKSVQVESVTEGASSTQTANAADDTTTATQANTDSRAGTVTRDAVLTRIGDRILVWDVDDSGQMPQ
ncbi:MAG: hypothetical protein AAFP69_11955, partial [Planctomycetota bacterium]